MCPTVDRKGKGRGGGAGHEWEGTVAIRQGGGCCKGGDRGLLEAQEKKRRSPIQVESKARGGEKKGEEGREG